MERSLAVLELDPLPLPFQLTPTLIDFSIKGFDEREEKGREFGVKSSAVLMARGGCLG